MLDRAIAQLKSPVTGIIVSQDSHFKDEIKDNELIKWEKFDDVDSALHYILENDEIEDIEIIIVDSNVKDKEKIVNNSEIKDGKLTLVLDVGKLREQDLDNYSDYNETSLKKIIDRLNDYLIAQQKMKAEKIKNVIEAKRDLHKHIKSLVKSRSDEEVKQVINNIYNIDSLSTKEHIYRTYLAYKHYLNEELDNFIKNGRIDRIEKTLLKEDFDKLKNSNYDKEVLQDIVETYSKAVILHDIGKIYVDERILDSNIAFRLSEVEKERLDKFYNVDKKEFDSVKEKLLVNYIEQHSKVSHLLLDRQSKYFHNDHEMQKFLKLSLFMSVSHHKSYLKDIKKEMNIKNSFIDIDKEINKRAINLAEGIDQFEAIMSERTYREAQDIREILNSEKIDIFPPHLRNIINNHRNLFISTYVYIYNNKDNISSFSEKSKINIYNNLETIKEMNLYDFNIEIEKNDIELNLKDI